MQAGIEWNYNPIKPDVKQIVADEPELQHLIKKDKE